jgi:hypothetical protein
MALVNGLIVSGFGTYVCKCENRYIARFAADE